MWALIPILLISARQTQPVYGMILPSETSYSAEDGLFTLLATTIDGAKMQCDFEDKADAVDKRFRHADDTAPSDEYEAYVAIHQKPFKDMYAAGQLKKCHLRSLVEVIRTEPYLKHTIYTGHVPGSPQDLYSPDVQVDLYTTTIGPGPIVGAVQKEDLQTYLKYLSDGDTTVANGLIGLGQVTKLAEYDELKVVEPPTDDEPASILRVRVVTGKHQGELIYLQRHFISEAGPINEEVPKKKGKKHKKGGF